MATNEVSVRTGGGFFLSALSLIFVVGKIWGPLESWSWWAVFAPIWIPFAIVLLVALIALIVLFVRELTK